MKIYNPKITLTVFAFMSLLIQQSTANTGNDWDKVRERGLQPGKVYEVSSGTGFFVAPSYVVTSEHVVDDCLTISIRGAVNPSSAQLVAFDKKKDLAILKTTESTSKVASLRANKGLNIDDPVFIIGYPLEHAKDGTYTVKQAQIVGFDPSHDHTEYIEFTSVIEHGNSGGPVLDTEGNVVGLVEAKRKYYQVSINQFGEMSTATHPVKVDGVAISVAPLEEFLSQYNIPFTSTPSYDMLLNFNPAAQAQDYVVNVHCVR